MNQRFSLAAGALLTLAVGAMLCTGARAQFSDVPANHWAAGAVKKLAAAKIVTGEQPAAPQKPAPGKTAAAKPAYRGDKPVTRYELAVTLYRFLQHLENADKQRKGKLNVQSVPKDGADAVKQLIAAGYLPKNSLLAQEGGKFVTADQLSDVLAQALTQYVENRVPVTPESRYDTIERPQTSPST